MGRLCVAVIASLSFATFSSTAYAFVQTVTTNGTPVRWTGNVKLDLAGNPTNRSGISEQAFNAAVVRSLQRWNRASSARVGFDYWQGTNSSIYEPDSDYNGLSSIYFASNAKTDQHLSPNVLGLTQVWYNTDTGEILETDIVLNDHDFHFTTDPRDTSGYGSAVNSGHAGGRNSVYIENVLTHELGHAFGLSHSGGLQSTMLFMESPEQAHLGCDESIGIHALYPTSDGGARGAVAGTVTSGSGQPIFGAHVQAISRRRGTVLATGMTDKSGHYKISALEQGTYFLMAEPFYAGSSALPSFYGAANPNICPGGQAFSRTLLMEGGFRPVAIAVGGGGTASAPNLAVGCTDSGGASLSSDSASSRSGSAPVVFDGNRDGSGFGIVDRFGNSNAVYYKLHAVSGHLELHALSYSLYSPVHPSLSLQDAYGGYVATARVQESVYTGDSGYVNYDSSLSVDGLPAGDYLVQVTGAAMEASRYPAGPIALDSVPFMVITGSINEAEPLLAGALSVNARCLQDEKFAAYASPPGNPPRHSTDDGGGGTGFCGTLAAGGGSSGPSSGPSGGAVAGWLLPWAAMALIAKIAQAMARGRRQRFGITRLLVPGRTNG